jgi:hypothetical protein
MLSNTEWAKNLKVGDDVAERVRGYGFRGREAFRLAKVARLTATQIIVVSRPDPGREPRRYNRATGKRIGGDYGEWIVEITDAVQAEMAEAKAAAILDTLRGHTAGVLDKLRAGVWEMSREKCLAVLAMNPALTIRLPFTGNAEGGPETEHEGEDPL